MSKHHDENFSFSSESGIRLMPENGIRFDDKGNPVYQGSTQHLLQSPLLEQELSLSAEQSPDSLQARAAAGFGYNPYEHSAQRNDTMRSKKLDMRELSKWIEAKKRAEALREKKATER